MAATEAPRRPRRARRMNDKQLGAMLDTIKQSDCVVLKSTIPLPEQRAALLALGLDPLQAQVRLVYFFDTPTLALQKAGVVVRARRVQGKGEDTVVKLRPVVPTELPDEWRTSRSSTSRSTRCRAASCARAR